MMVVACLVTRADGPDLQPILDTLPASWGRVIWRNGDRATITPDAAADAVVLPVDDFAVAGRYRAVVAADMELVPRADLVYVQDDDCLVDAERIVAAAEPGRLVANMPQSRWADYPDSTMVGWGAVFNPVLALEAIRAWEVCGHSVSDDRFNRCCDVIVSALSPRTVIDIGFSHLPFAHDPDRMHKQPGHKRERDDTLNVCRDVRRQLGLPNDDRRIVA